MRWKRLSILLLVFASVWTCAGTDEGRQRRVDLGGHALFASIYGSGTPLVVVDVGFGDSWTHWEPVLQRLSRHTRCLAYDRAGYGRSDPGPMPRHSRQVARELRELLTALSVDDPVVLVGHSLGGLNAEVFAAEYPDRVAGLVLLDPPPRDWLQGKTFPRLRRTALDETANMLRAAQNATAAGEDRRANFLKTLASEHKQMLTVGAVQTAALKDFKNIPLLVMGAGRPDPRFGTDAAAFREYWNAQSRRLAARSSRGVFLPAPNCSHNLYRDDPDLVLNAILRVLRLVRRGNAARDDGG